MVEMDLRYCSNLVQARVYFEEIAGSTVFIVAVSADREGVAWGANSNDCKKVWYSLPFFRSMVKTYICTD